MVRIALCDDDSYFLRRFQRTLWQVFQNKAERIDCFTNSKDLLNSEIEYDLLFLDIDMPEISGIDIAKNYKNREAIVVFVTNRESLVFEAYNSTDSFGFIRKSHIKEDFYAIIKRLNKNKSAIATLTIKNAGKIVKVKYSEIIYIEKLVNNVIIHTVKGVYSERNTISALEKLLSDYGFVRCHIGYIVNLDYIILIDSTEIILNNSERIPLSRRNVKNVKSIFLKRSGNLIE